MLFNEFVKKNIEIEKVRHEKIKDPIDPDTVLLGEIFVSFRPLNIFPNTYPPISEAIQDKKSEKKIIFKYDIFEKYTVKIQNIKM